MRNDQQTDVLEKIIHELMPDSIRINTMSRVFNAKNGTIGATPGMTIERTYLETARGERYYEEYMVEPGTADVRVIHFSTGKKRAQVFYKEGETSKVAAAGEVADFRDETKSEYYEASEPFRYSRVGMVPLQEALPNAEKLGEAELLGRPCDRYLFAEVKSPGSSQSLVYTLDRATSVPLKVAAYKDVQHARDEQPTWVWEAFSLDTVGDRHFPFKSQYQLYKWSEAEMEYTTQLDIKYDIEVKSIEYDKSYPASMFWPAAEIAEYDAAIKAGLKAAMTSAPSPVTQVADPITADPNGESWPMWPGLALSGVLLVAALIVRMRSQ